MIGTILRAAWRALKGIGAFLRDALDGSEERHTQIRGERPDTRSHGVY